MSSSILNIQSSARHSDSITRQLSADVIDAVGDQHVVNRDLATGIPFVNEAWVGANFTAANERTDAHRDVLAYSDSLVDEVEQADVLVIGVPIYNFGVPAVLKAWIDMVARVGRTFHYSDKGPVGLLEDKRAIVVIASGGTTSGSDIDFATGYMRHVLGFIGIHDVTVIAADTLGANAEEKLLHVKDQISQLTRS